MDFIASFFKGIFWFGVICFGFGVYIGLEMSEADSYFQLEKENPALAAKLNKGIEKNMFVKLDTWIINL